MAEIPGLMWSVVGILIGVFSLFLGFLRKVEYYTFFRLMMFVGLGMFGYGVVKLYIRRKTAQKEFQAKKHELIQRRERTVDIDIDNYRKTPQLRQQTVHQNKHVHHQTHYQQQQRTQHQAQPSHSTQHHQYPQHRQLKQKSAFCTQCGTPLLPKHKFCPICGARV